jgi:IclR family KDG regulon transcriptional repressor
MLQLDEVLALVENGSQTLAKGLIVLEVVAKYHEGHGARLVDICNELDIHKTTGHRLLGTLEALGYVEKDPENERFRLGLKLLALSTSLLEGLEVRSQASSFLNDLMLKTNHAAHLVVLDRTSGDVVYIDKVDSPQPVRMYTYVGIRFPANCAAAGKAILAHLPENELRPLLSNLQGQTPNSITSPEVLQEELEQIRLTGYATDDEENALGIRCVGAPILDQRGQVIAAISISAASTYLPKEEFPQVAQLVMEAAQGISRRMGYRL